MVSVVQGGSGMPSGELLQCFLKQREKSMFASEELMKNGNVLHDRTESHAPRLCSPSVVCSPNATLPGSYFSSNHTLNKSTESGDNMELKEDKIYLMEKVATELGSRPLTDHVPKANLLSSTKVKDEPYDHVDDCNMDMKNVFSNTVSIKSETTIPDEHYENKLDNMRLQDRMKFFSSRKVFDFTSMDSEHPKPSDPGCSILVSEPASLMNIKRRRKWKKTATYVLGILHLKVGILSPPPKKKKLSCVFSISLRCYTCHFICRNSIETALEEDAPGLLQVLISCVTQLCLRIWIVFYCDVALVSFHLK